MPSERDPVEELEMNDSDIPDDDLLSDTEVYDEADQEFDEDVEPDYEDDPQELDFEPEDFDDAPEIDVDDFV